MPNNLAPPSKRQQEKEEKPAASLADLDEETGFLGDDGSQLKKEQRRCRCQLCNKKLLFAAFLLLLLLLPLAITLTSVTSSNEVVLEAVSYDAPRTFLDYYQQGFSTYDSRGKEQEWRLGMYPANWSHYPFTLQDFSRSYTPGSIQQCAMQRVIQKLDRGDKVKIGTYGGSITFGHACKSDYWHGQDCAWPARLQHFLQVMHPEWNIEVLNLAKPAWGSNQFNSLVKEPDVADMYVLEFSLNDSPPQATEEFMGKLAGPKLFLILARSCSGNLVGCEYYAKRFYGSRNCSQPPVCDKRLGEMILVPSNGRPRLPGPEAYDPLSPACTAYVHWKRADNMDAYKRRGYPFSNYRDFMWPDALHPRPDYGTIWNGESHPDTVGHDFLAHTVLYAVTKEFDAAKLALERNHGVPCDDTAPQAEAVAVTACKRLSEFDANQGNKAPSGPLQSIGWRLFEDRPDKPGWIAEEFGEHSLLEFELNITQSLMVGFMRTYEKASVAQMRVEGCEEEIDLNPIWTERSSTTALATFTATGSVENKPDHALLPCLANHDMSKPIKVSFKARLGKFKLVTLYSC